MIGIDAVRAIKDAVKSELAKDAGSDSPDDLKVDFCFKLGNDQWGFTVSGLMENEKLKDQLPNTAAAVEMAASVVSLLKPLIPGIGDAVQQAAKFIPEMPVPKHNEFFGNIPYIFDVKGEGDWKAWLPQKQFVSGRCNSLAVS